MHQHVLLDLCICTQLLWLSKVWEARIYLEVKLNLIGTSELIIDIVVIILLNVLL